MALYANKIEKKNHCFSSKMLKFIFALKNILPVNIYVCTLFTKMYNKSIKIKTQHFYLDFFCFRKLVEVACLLAESVAGDYIYTCILLLRPVRRSIYMCISCFDRQSPDYWPLEMPAGLSSNRVIKFPFIWFWLTIVPAWPDPYVHKLYTCIMPVRGKARLA